MAFDIIGAGVVVLHMAVIGSLVLWFGLKKPTTWAKFRTEFRKQFLSFGGPGR